MLYTREHSHAIISDYVRKHFMHFVRNTRMKTSVQVCKTQYLRSSSLQRNKCLNQKLPEIFYVVDVADTIE